LQFERISVEKGLSQSTVSFILQVRIARGLCGLLQMAD
jgi:hypothetical protein